MALKKKLKEVPEELKSFYIEKDGEFVLDIEGEEDTGALKRAKDREVQLRREAEMKAKELEQKLVDIEGVDARKRGDIETLEKAWAKKNSEIEMKYKASLAQREESLKQMLIDNVANELAHKISISPKLMLPHIKARLVADLDGDMPTTKVLDSIGKLSALTIEDLQKEFVANPDFSAIIVGSKASGSSAPKVSSQKGSATQEERIDLSKISPESLAAYLQDRNS